MDGSESPRIAYFEISTSSVALVLPPTHAVKTTPKR
jgi:hypothetical protein